jgi:hypothetical protein
MTDTALSSEQADFKIPYLEAFYGTLFHPVDTFNTLIKANSSQLLLFAMLTVAGVSAVIPTVQQIYKGTDPGWLFWLIPIAAISGLAVWLLMGVILSMLGYSFTGTLKLKPLLVLTGFATLPWIFQAPLALLKAGLGTMGVLIALGSGLAMWAWSVLLFALALSVTFRLPLDRLLILLGMPFLLNMVGFAWFTGFISKVQTLLP